VFLCYFPREIVCPTHGRAEEAILGRPREWTHFHSWEVIHRVRRVL